MAKAMTKRTSKQASKQSAKQLTNKQSVKSSSLSCRWIIQSVTDTHSTISRSLALINCIIQSEREREGWRERGGREREGERERETGVG